jgi:hypothetical protein
MNATATLGSVTSPIYAHQQNWQKLLDGEILLENRPYSAWGGAVTAQMYLAIKPAVAWQQIIDYPRWIQYFPSLNRSDILHMPNAAAVGYKRVYQAASKTFLMLTAQVEVYLKIFEHRHPTGGYSIQFCLEQGSFKDFSADLKLQTFEGGTLLTYAVQATPTIPVPAFLIQEAIRFDLPNNMRSMRQALCQSF